MARDARDLANKFQRLASTTPRTSTTGVINGAQAAKTNVQAAMVATGVQPGRKLRSGGAVNVGYSIKPGRNPSAIVAMRGPAQLVNNRTKSHRIYPRNSVNGRGRRAGKRALTIGPNVRARAYHTGTRGKQFWQKSAAVNRAKVPAVVFAAHRGALLREFTHG